jgi:hypothetical protein
MPLLLRGLNLPDNELRVGVIDTLIATTDPHSKDNELVSKYAGSLVIVMLKNAKAKDMSSPVRKKWGRTAGKVIKLCFIRPLGFPRCDTLAYCRAWFGTISCIPRRLRSSVSSPRVWTIRGGRLGTKLFTLEPNGEVYTRVHLYTVGTLNSTRFPRFQYTG